MSDDPQSTATTPENDSQGQAPETMPEWVSDPNRAWDTIRELREENRSRRLENSSVTEQLEQLSQTMNQLLPQEEEPVEHDNPVDALTARLDTLQQSLEQERNQRIEAEQQALRQQIANELNLPPALASRIQGDTAEAMREDATALAGLIVPPQQEQQASNSRQNRFQTTQVPTGQASVNRDGERQRMYFGSQS